MKMVSMVLMVLVAILVLLESNIALAEWDGHGEERYGNQYGNSTNSLKLYDQNGQFRGNLNDNRYDPDSVSNPYGRYGNRYSPESINNPYRTW